MTSTTRLHTATPCSGAMSARRFGMYVAAKKCKTSLSSKVRYGLPFGELKLIHHRDGGLAAYFGQSTPKFRRFGMTILWTTLKKRALLGGTITLASFRDACRNYPERKALGVDGWRSWELAVLPDTILRAVVSLINKQVSTGSWNHDLETVWMALLPKPTGGLRTVGKTRCTGCGVRRGDQRF